ncbi:hypothetical protein DA717_12295 [Piscirickettsiaceae bacterium NZ-RLO2]|nr:hypothetical protein DA717_12295 [Piscirickettsiaceae bacterium NZ-RLO2]
MECADSRHVTLCDADSRGFIVVAFCSAILHHWMCKIPTEVATLTKKNQAFKKKFYKSRSRETRMMYDNFQKGSDTAEQYFQAKPVSSGPEV